MFRHSFKLPLRVLRKPSRYPLGFSRLYRTTCLYQNRLKEDQRECPKDGSGRGFYYTVGAVIIGTSAVVAYAKYDEEFRSWLRENIPGSDEFISFATAEETSRIDYLKRLISNWTEKAMDNIYELIGGTPKKTPPLPPCDEEQKPYVPPKSAFKPLLDSAKSSQEKYTEQRITEQKGDEVTIAPVESTVRKSITDGAEADLHPMNLMELENAINEAAQDAIKAFTEAICVLRDHADEIYRLVEESVEKVDTKIWNQIKAKGEERERLLSKAEKAAKEATNNIDKLKEKLEDPNLPGGEESREAALRNIEKVLRAVDDAKKTYENERAKVAITDKYWTKVQEARRHFAEELEILFPNVRLSERNLKLADGELDLFILYAFQNILYYQKELSKIDTVSRMKLKQALEKTSAGDPKVIEAAVEAEMDKERRKIGLEFQKRMLTLRAECERDMRLQMKRQAEAHSDHLVEAMAMKEKEMERKMKRRMEEEVMKEKNEFKAKMAGMIGRLKGIDDAMKKRASEDKKAQQSQILWSACQSLEASLRSGSCTSPWSDQLRPLQDEVTAISKAAAPGDELVAAVVASIPDEALERGVYSEAALRDRFLRVERVAQRVALLPDGGAALPVMLISYIQSLFIIKAANPIPSYELANEPFEPAKFNTYDILQRARFWIDRGDFAQCLRYMNLLSGAPRAVASEWMKEVRIFLETQQAAQALMAHASACGLVYS